VIALLCWLGSIYQEASGGLPALNNKRARFRLAAFDNFIAREATRFGREGA
jgi:hypothetical protein